MRFPRAIAVGVFLAALLSATTLEQLSLDDLVNQSTAIVRAKVTGSYSANRNGAIYTHYNLQPIEILKGSPQVDIAIPGGSLSNVRQVVAGAPVLATGQEYVFFIWTGKSGLAQIMGLSQGAFTVTRDTSGKTILRRAPSSELMLDRNGQPTQDQAVTINLDDVRARIGGQK